MPDDPFARAAERAAAAERREQDSKAQRRQEKWSEGNRTAFRTHLTVYLVVNFMLIALWYTTWKLNGGTSYPWFMWVTFGWGIGLAAHWSAAHNHLKRQRYEQRNLVEPPQAQPQQYAASGALAAPPQYAAPAVAQPVPVAPSTIDDLDRLAQLHTNGHLTDEEFTAAKAKLLG